MDGGLDLAIRDRPGRQVQTQVQARVQEMIVAQHHGEMPVGMAAVVATEHAEWP
jgi:O-acetyl-ADP-ribose deacetylase (regulator of RNase III)